MNKPLLISCSGLSRSGKNTFCDLVQVEIQKRFNLKCCQLSFAYQIRLDTQDFLEKCGFDVWSSVNKELFRPVLTWYGKTRRYQSQGQFFINKVKNDLEIKRTGGYYKIFLLSDLRFKEFEYDELDFCKENGIVVHLSKYKTISSTLIHPITNEPATITSGKILDLPPNELEAKNDPILKQNTDYLIEWENQNGNTENLKPHIDKFVNWLSEKYL